MTLGLASAGQVGVVGWKYLTAAESDDPSRPAWVPAVIVDSSAPRHRRPIRST